MGLGHKQIQNSECPQGPLRAGRGRPRGSPQFETSAAPSIQARLPTQAAKLYGDRVTLKQRKTGARVCATLLLCALQAFALAAQSPPAPAFDDLLKQGFDLHQQARFAEAIPILEQARHLQPSDYFANLLLGIDLLRTGKAAEAVPRLELAARIKPEEEFPEDYLGEANASLARFAPAAEAYQRALQRGHNSEQALEAWAGFALERFRTLGEFLRSSTAGTGAARRLAEASQRPIQRAACEAPIPALERKLGLIPATGKQAPAAVEAAYQLSLCYAAAAGDAASLLQSAQEDPSAVHRLRGDVLLRLKADAPAAEAEYRTALSAHPNDPALLERLAEAQLTAGEPDAARQSAQSALAIDPHRREALRTLASISVTNRDYDQALPWLRQLAQESPGDRSVQVELGKALAQTGSAQQAADLLGPALAAGYPDEKGALHALLARVLRKLGRDVEAAKADAEARRLSDAFQAHSTPTGSPDANH